MVFSAMGRVGGSLRPLFSFFLISDRIHERFFDFRSYSQSFLALGGLWGVPGESLRGSLGDLGWSGEIPGGSLGLAEGFLGGPRRSLEVPQGLLGDPWVV